MTVAIRHAFGRLRDWAATNRRQRALLHAKVWKTAIHPDDLAGSTAAPPDGELDPELAPILGEFAWHSLTLDATLAETSEAHYSVVAELLANEHRGATRGAHALEVAAYAHTTGYLLYQRLGVHTDLLDISPSTLRLGRRLARDQNLPLEGTTCVAGDFHHLPYADDQFHLVYICSALHHTWRWPQVLSEMVRVLAPGGLLLLENEPCRRRFCHYLFRANREERSAFEQTLDRLGILRTVAEPIPGTRPEGLFGMVENQTIPIGQLCGLLAAGCTPVAATIKPEVCMDELEQALLDRRGNQAESTCWLVREMTRRVDEARPTMSEADRGMGFALPSQDEIERLCASTVAALADLPSDSASADFRIGLADIFGGSLQMTMRKKGRMRAVPAAHLSQPHPTHDEVVYAFPPRIALLLDPDRTTLPEIQPATADALNDAFPVSDWTLVVSNAGLRALAPKAAQPSFIVPVAKPGPLLILVRLHVVVDGEPFRVMLCRDDEELAGFDAYRTDSLLLRPIVDCMPPTSSLRMTLRTRALGAVADDGGSRIFNVSYAGAFSLDASEIV